MTIKEIARVCHEANRYLCLTLGDTSQAEWHNAHEWQRVSAENGVRRLIEDPFTTEEQMHDGWCEEKLATGWVYGEAKDTEAKTHPCLVSYHQLPPEQRAKDALFRGVALALLPLLTDRPE